MVVSHSHFNLDLNSANERLIIFVEKHYPREAIIVRVLFTSVLV